MIVQQRKASEWFTLFEGTTWGNILALRVSRREGTMGGVDRLVRHALKARESRQQRPFALLPSVERDRASSGHWQSPSTARAMCQNCCNPLASHQKRKSAFFLKCLSVLLSLMWLKLRTRQSGTLRCTCTPRAIISNKTLPNFYGFPVDFARLDIYLPTSAKVVSRPF